ncbi:MAG: hypothetical protein IJD14_00395 [Christensenellaceae bacterium]|nr:hypothetical protein [Christensenellaceae bacterium]
MNILKRFLIITLVVLMLMSMSGCMSGNIFDAIKNAANKNHPVEPSNNTVTADRTGQYFPMYLDSSYFCYGQESEVLVIAEAGVTGINMDLYMNDVNISAMYDDGMGADTYADDGIYTALVSVSGNEGENFFTAQASDGSISHTQTAYFFGTPSDDDINFITEINEAFTVLEHEYMWNYGEYNHEILLSMMEETEDLLDDYANSGEIIDIYTNTDDYSVTAKFSCGLSMCFVPEIHGLDALGSSGPVSITTCQPYYSSYEHALDYMDLPDNAAWEISQSLSGYEFAYNFDDEYVDLNVIKNFGPNEIILWHDHGNWTQKLGSFLRTGERFDWNLFKNDHSYFADTVTDRIIADSNYFVCITDGFIEKYIPDMTDSIVYLAACSSGKDTRLADAFLKKGAAAVIANNESIYTEYNLKMMYSTMTNLAKIDPSTGNYYNLRNALAAASEEHGFDDSAYKPYALPAYPVIFGDGSVSLCDIAANPPAPTPEPTPEPVKDNPADALNAYRRVLETYAWTDYTVSDLSEIPKDQYADYWLGSYTLCDINKDGIHELIVKCGQAMADMSFTFFTYLNGQVYCIGSEKVGDAFPMAAYEGTGLMAVELHGGWGVDTLFDMQQNGSLYIKSVKDYNYEDPSYENDKYGVYYDLMMCSVHDMAFIDENLAALN